MRLVRINIVFIVVLVLAFIAFASSKEQACNATYQCGTGYCEKGKCLLPSVTNYDTAGTCNTSEDCIIGYCNANGQCIVPKSTQQPAVTLFPSIKSGCSGLSEETRDFGSVAVCSSFWVLVPIFSILAGVAGSNEKLKIIPIIAVFVPILVALFTLPYLGLAVAIIELVLLAGRRFGKR